MRPRIEIIDSVSDPAKPDAENDDRLGWNASAVFVIDGATGLGDPVIAPPASDAAWLAEHARRHLEMELRPEREIVDVVRELCATARDAFFSAAGTTEVERYRYPNAAFQSLHLTSRGMETAGLADCTVILRDSSGHVHRHSGTPRPLRNHEQDGARRTVAQRGGFNAAGEGFRKAEVLENLRAKRSRLNSDPEGVWTLGVVPEAAEHMRIERLDVPVPATAILCTDGFADLVDNYGICTEAALIERAEAAGLQALLDELRRIERVVDPDGVQFPRYKRCDDASAVLVRLTG